MTDDHRADPYTDPRGALRCKTCDGAVRTAYGGQHPIHAEPRPRFRPCEACGGSPDIHNTNRGLDFVGHEYR